MTTALTSSRLLPAFKVFMAPGAGEAVSKVLNSGFISQGKKVIEYEGELSRFFRNPEGTVVVSSASAAFFLLIRMLLH